MEKFPKIYKSFSKIDKNSSKINKNLPKINRICQKLTKIRENQRKFVKNHLKFGTKIWHCHPSSPKNFPSLCRFFKIPSSKKRHKSGTRLYILYIHEFVNNISYNVITTCFNKIISYKILPSEK